MKCIYKRQIPNYFIIFNKQDISLIYRQNFKNMARRKCSNCEYGGYDPCSDICDACMCDADTGWGGFYDHSIGRHFDSEEEQRKYYEEHVDDCDDSDDDD